MKFADHVKRAIAPGAELEPIRGLANKLPEHAARLSAVLTLVARVVHSAGYNRLSFTRAFAVLNCQSALVCFLLRSACHASTSCFNTR